MVSPFPGHQVATLAGRRAADSATATDACSYAQGPAGARSESELSNIDDRRDSLRIGLFERTTYEAIGRDRKVGFVARRLTLTGRVSIQTRNEDFDDDARRVGVVRRHVLRPSVSVAGAAVRPGAAGREAVIEEVGGPSMTVALARSSLADARVDLDNAVSSLSRTHDETVMATSSLVDLLLRVVTARRHLEDLEGRQNAGSTASLR
jgi:hypothetical protein